MEMNEFILFINLTVLFFLAARLYLNYSRKKKTVAFFHPYCNSAGGGERVLWSAINALQLRFKDANYTYAIYTGDIGVGPEEILAKVRDRFGIDIDSDTVQFVYIRWRRILEADLYPRFTLICQAFAGLIVGLEALCRLNPAIFVDSTGCPLTLPLFKAIGGCRVAVYVHYPTISTDMIQLVESGRGTYNNAPFIASSPVLSRVKLFYYRTFALLYRFCGMGADTILVNSTWTFGHIAELWKRPGDTAVIYPPCDVRNTFARVQNVAENRLTNENNVLNIVSVGQIRPEKNHGLQLEILAELLNKRKMANSEMNIQIRLVIAGGCRNREDWTRIDQLREYARDLDVADFVEWKLNIGLDELKREMAAALIGLHTMWNEHFGISVVEGMAAGNIMIANDSGGPKLDILKTAPDGRQVGFLASTVDEYADAIEMVLAMTCSERDAIRLAAKDAALKFSQEEFSEKICRHFEQLLLD